MMLITLINLITQFFLPLLLVGLSVAQCAKQRETVREDNGPSSTSTRSTRIKRRSKEMASNSFRTLRGLLLRDETPAKPIEQPIKEQAVIQSQNDEEQPIDYEQAMNDVSDCQAEKGPNLSTTITEMSPKLNSDSKPQEVTSSRLASELEDTQFSRERQDDQPKSRKLEKIETMESTEPTNKSQKTKTSHVGSSMISKKVEKTKTPSSKVFESTEPQTAFSTSDREAKVMNRHPLHHVATTSKQEERVLKKKATPMPLDTQRGPDSEYIGFSPAEVRCALDRKPTTTVTAKSKAESEARPAISRVVSRNPTEVSKAKSRLPGDDPKTAIEGDEIMKSKGMQTPAKSRHGRVIPLSDMSTVKVEVPDEKSVKSKSVQCDVEKEVKQESSIKGKDKKLKHPKVKKMKMTTGDKILSFFSGKDKKKKAKGKSDREKKKEEKDEKSPKRDKLGSAKSTKSKKGDKKTKMKEKKEDSEQSLKNESLKSKKAVKKRSRGILAIIGAKPSEHEVSKELLAVKS